MSVRAVLFDAFGTVIHPEPEWPGTARDRCLREVLASVPAALPFDAFHAAYEAARARQHATVDMDLREFDFAARFADAFRACGAPPSAARAWGTRAADAYHAFQGRLVRPYDEPAPVLNALRGRGLAVALVSNYAHSGHLEAAFRREGLRDLFDAFVVSGDRGWLKPHAAIFHEACDALGVAPADTVMVGNDWGCDVEGARAAGLRAVWSPYPRPRPVTPPGPVDAVVQSLREVPALVDAWRR